VVTEELPEIVSIKMMNIYMSTH